MMLMELQSRMHNTLVIVSHDMGVHYQITKRMGIMYSGSLMELGTTDEIFSNPLHPYTKMLIGALPKVGDKSTREGIPGGPPSACAILRRAAGSRPGASRRGRSAASRCPNSSRWRRAGSRPVTCWGK